MPLTVISCLFKRPTWTDWEEKEEIVRKTKNCADLTLDIFAKTDDGKNMPYR